MQYNSAAFILILFETWLNFSFILSIKCFDILKLKSVLVKLLFSSIAFKILMNNSKHFITIIGCLSSINIIIILIKQTIYLFVSSIFSGSDIIISFIFSIKKLKASSCLKILLLNNFFNISSPNNFIRTSYFSDNSEGISSEYLSSLISSFDIYKESTLLFSLSFSFSEL